MHSDFKKRSDCAVIKCCSRRKYTIECRLLLSELSSSNAHFPARFSHHLTFELSARVSNLTLEILAPAPSNRGIATLGKRAPVTYVSGSFPLWASIVKFRNHRICDPLFEQRVDVSPASY